jgi:hypothetical protein
MERAYYVGVDIAKTIFQVFASGGEGREIGNSKTYWNSLIEFFAKLHPRTSGMANCATTHY